MMFLWVFSLPFAIASDSSSSLAHMLCVFFMTYAFFGLEEMSKQLGKLSFGKLMMIVKPCWICETKIINPGIYKFHTFTSKLLTPFLPFFAFKLVTITLEDPFGHDDNDFDNLGLARSVMEDVFAIIDIIDGTDWALKVRDKMRSGDEDRRYSIHTETTHLLGAWRILERYVCSVSCILIYVWKKEEDVIKYW